MRLPPSFIEELKHRMPIEEVIASYVDIKRAGANLKGLCPFHSEKTPSFVVYSDNQSYYCFGCGSGGDSITFIMQMEHLEYMEAVKLLAQKAGMTMPEDSYDDRAERMRLRILELNREAGRFFHNCLISPGGRVGMEYLQQRQLPMGLIRKFGIGYAPDNWDEAMKYFRSKGFSDEEMIAAGIAKKSQKGSIYCYFRGRVMFPIIDVRGNVVAFGGRILTDQKPKYLNSPDSPVYKKTRQLYALNFAKNTKTDTVVLTEGYMDAISLYKAGMDSAVATCGTALTDEQARLMAKYAHQVVIAYDSDEAGQKATARAISILDKVGLHVRILSIEGAKDPDEYIKKFGADKLVHSVTASANAYAFRLNAARKQFNLLSDEGKVEYLKEAVDILAEITSPVEREVFVGRIAAEVEIDRKAIEASVKNAEKRRLRREKRRTVMKAERSPVTESMEKVNPERRGKISGAKAEDILLACVIRHPDKLEKIRDGLSGEPLATQLGNRLLSAIEEQIQSTGAFELSHCAGEFTATEMSYLAGIIARNDGMIITDEVVEDCTATIRRENRKIASNDVGKLSDSKYEEYLQQLMENKK